MLCSMQDNTEQHADSPNEPGKNNHFKEDSILLQIAVEEILEIIFKTES